MEMTGPHIQAGLPGGRGTSSPIRRAVRTWSDRGSTANR